MSPSEEGGAGSKVRDRGGNLAAFFEPARDGVARDPEGARAREAPERGAFLASAKDLLAPLGCIGVRGGILPAFPAAVVAEGLLLSVVWSLSALYDVFAATVIAGDKFSEHSSIFSFGFDPL